MASDKQRAITSRREFLCAGTLAALTPGALLRPDALAAGTPSAPLRAAKRQGEIVNDVHSRLNATRVAAVESPQSARALRHLVRRAADERSAISIAGGRHAMGGQQFGTATTLLDMRSMNRVLALDREAGIVEVEAGIQWPELVGWLERAQGDNAGAWTIVQKQTGADRLSLGGALSANIHSRGLRLRPIIQDVESFVLIDADGNQRHCSRSENQELFALAIGGYGLLGPIASVRLRLGRRHKVQRVVELTEVDDLMAAFEARIAAGFEYGDFQFATAAGNDSFLRRGVFSCYRPVPNDTPMPDEQSALSPSDWHELAYLAHVDPARAFEIYAGYYLSTNNQVYWSDLQQMSYYDDDYHVALSRRLGHQHAGSEMITEIYVPRAALATFMDVARDELRRHDAPLIYGTVRLIERDDESYLAWARQPWACVIFNLHVDHTEPGRAAAVDAFRTLIDAGLRCDGSYYLTYHRWARREQVEAAHPRLRRFLQRKLEHDPDERFQSDWYRHCRALLGL